MDVRVGLQRKLSTEELMLLTMVLEKTLESPLDCKEIQPVHPEYSLEGLMLKLKLQYFGHLMWRTDSFEKTLMLGRTSLVAQTVKHLSTMRETWVQSLGWEDPLERKRQSTPVLLPGKSHGQRSLEGTVHGVTKSQTRLSDFTFDAGKD